MKPEPSLCLASALPRLPRAQRGRGSFLWASAMVELWGQRLVTAWRNLSGTELKGELSVAGQEEKQVSVANQESRTPRSPPDELGGLS